LKVAAVAKFKDRDFPFTLLLRDVVKVVTRIAIVKLVNLDLVGDLIAPILRRSPARYPTLPEVVFAPLDSVVYLSFDGVQIRVPLGACEFIRVGYVGKGKGHPNRDCEKRQGGKER